MQGLFNKATKEIKMHEHGIDLKIHSVSLDKNSMDITIIRNPGGGEILGTVFKAEGKNISETFIERTPMKELEIKTYHLDMVSIYSPESIKIKISPIFQIESGEEIVGEVKDEYRFSWSKQSQ